MTNAEFNFQCTTLARPVHHQGKSVVAKKNHGTGNALAKVKDIVASFLVIESEQLPAAACCYPFSFSPKVFTT